MKCRICATECPPGAKLCRDCAAARKRAFAATVTQPLLAAAGAPSIGRPRFAPRPARPRTASKPAAAAARSEAAMAASAADGESAAKKPLGLHWLLLALAIASAAVYLLVQILFVPHAQRAADANAPVESASDRAPAAASGTPGAAVGPPLPVPAAAGGIAGQPGTAEGEADAALKEALPKPPRHKVASRIEVPAIAPTPAPPPAPEPAPAPRSVPPPVVESPPDPWQAMNEGLSRCGREDLLSRAACEQRLRLQYCPNHWGVVWQCPIGPATDHGQ